MHRYGSSFHHNESIGFWMLYVILHFCLYSIQSNHKIQILILRPNSWHIFQFLFDLSGFYSCPRSSARPWQLWHLYSGSEKQGLKWFNSTTCWFTLSVLVILNSYLALKSQSAVKLTLALVWLWRSKKRKTNKTYNWIEISFL